MMRILGVSAVSLKVTESMHKKRCPLCGERK